MKNVLFLAVFAGFLVLQASNVRLINNLERNGQPLIIPETREQVMQPGTFVLPKQWTISAEEEIIIRQLNQEVSRLGCRAVKAEQGSCQFIKTTKGIPENEQGYLLEITPEKITVTSRGNAGLFYGAQTLRNMLRNLAVPALKCCRIQDWPSLERRGYTLTIKNLPPKKLEELKRTIDTLASLKMNWVLIETGQAFPFKKNELTKRKSAFTWEQLKEIVDYCDERHIEITPVLQVLSHNEWMTYHPDWESLKEGEPNTRWNSQPCIQNEKARALTKTALEEHIELFHPKLFYIMMDEISHGPFRTCPRCQAVPAEKLLKDYLQFVMEIFDKSNVRPLFAHDSFVNNARWQYGDYMRSLLEPKKHEICWWTYGDTINFQPLEKLLQSHFTPFGTPIVGKTLNVQNIAREINKNGAKGVRMTFWYYSSGGSYCNLKHETPDSMGGLVAGADMLWHFTEAPYADYSYDGTYEMMRLRYPEKALPSQHSGRAVPISLNQSINAELSYSGVFPRLDDKILAELKENLQKMPENFVLATAPGGHYYGLRLTGQPTSQPGGRTAIAISLPSCKVTRLSFLLTATRPACGLDYYSYCIYGPKRFTYPVAASLNVHYADGQKKKIPLRYRYDFTDWNRPYSGFGMRFGVRGIDLDQHYFSFGVFEFENPRPDIPIEEIVIGSQKVDGVSPVLLALSAWGVNKPLSEIPPFTPEMIKRPYLLKEKMAAVSVRNDFETGIGPILLHKSGKFEGKVQMEIVPDPEGIHGKVLKVSVPKASLAGDGDAGLYVRISLDMPYTVTQKMKNLCFLTKISDTSDLVFAKQYLTTRPIDLPLSTPTQFRSYKFAPSKKWAMAASGTLDTPRSQEGDLKDLTLAATRRISFFFKKIDKPLEIYVDDIGDSEEPFDITPYFGVNTEAEP